MVIFKDPGFLLVSQSVFELELFSFGLLAPVCEFSLRAKQRPEENVHSHHGFWTLA